MSKLNFNLTRVLALFICLGLVINSLNPIFGIHIGQSYYAMILITLIILLIQIKNFSIDWSMFIFLIVLIASIIANDIPSFFRPIDRLISFLLLIGLLGPWFKARQLSNFRIQLFYRINILLCIISSISFVGLVSNQSWVFNKGQFTGLMNQSMVMGPVAAISILCSGYFLTTSQTFKSKIVYAVLICASFVNCIAAGSRGALLALMISALAFLYYYYKSKPIRLCKVLGLIVLLLSITYPIWSEYTNRIEEKMAYGEQQGSLYTSRDDLWQSRMREFRSSPLIGIGFASVSSSYSSHDFDRETGTIEPGSSWLAILAMTGIAGFISFVVIFFRSFRRVLGNKDNHVFFALLIALIVFFCVHMIIEGYVFSSGAFLCAYLWLLLSVCNRPYFSLAAYTFKKDSKTSRILDRI